MIEFETTGDFKQTRKSLKRLADPAFFDALDSWGKRGAQLLASATPATSGATARAWSYKIVKGKGTYAIEFHNSHINDGANIAILIQYGHATRGGTFVQGRDYINPVIKPMFDDMATQITRALNL